MAGGSAREGCQHSKVLGSSDDVFAAMQRAIHASAMLPPRVQEEAVTPRPRQALPAFACVSCGNSGRSRGAAAAHSASTGHPFTLDTKRSELFCCVCGDYVFDAAFDAAVSAAQCAAAARPDRAASEQRPPQPPPTPPHPPTDPALARQRDSDAVSSVEPRDGSDAAASPAAVAAGHGLPRGLRGLNNLGNTCFMNSVLQALLHAPLLRRYFLAAGHPAIACPQASADSPCLSCELDALYGAVYGGGQAPISPVALLHAWWRSAGGHLEGYQQQDSHEFYLTALSGLSASLATPAPSDSGGEAAGATSVLLAGAQPFPAAGAGSLHQNGSGMQHQQQQSAIDLTAEADEGSRPGSPVLLHSVSSGGFLSGIFDGGILPELLPLLPQQMQPQQATGMANGHAEPLLSQPLAAIPMVPAPAASAISLASSMCSDEDEADGIVQRVFGGLLRSDVTCRACGHTSTAFDPFLDLSLDLPPPPALPQVWQPQKGNAAKPPRPAASQVAASAAAAAATAETGQPSNGAGRLSGSRATPEPDTLGLQPPSTSGFTDGGRTSRAGTPAPGGPTCSSGGSQSVYRDAESASPRCHPAHPAPDPTRFLLWPMGVSGRTHLATGRATAGH